MPAFYEISLTLRPATNEYVEICLRGPAANSQVWEKRPLASLGKEIKRAENGYYVDAKWQDEVVGFGQKLFNWLDGERAMFRRELEAARKSGRFTLLRVEPNPELSHGVEHLPWELLHDGKGFLIQKEPKFLPYRAAAVRATAFTPVEGRALELCFMAASPENSTGARLSFEAEEAAIVAATADALVTEVEESGSLEELNYTLSNAAPPVDIVHLSGHAGLTDDGPVFETEDDFGQRVLSTPAEIIETLDVATPPRLVFLSGCSTARADTLGYSLAARIVGQRIPYVLAWAQPVGDDVATRAASLIYKRLVAQNDIVSATHYAMGKLLTGYRQKDPATGRSLEIPPSKQWHLPRLHLACPPMPLLTGPRVRPPVREYQQEFLDDERQVKVPSRADFIGRRRKLQAGLRHLKKAPKREIGLVIQGMGGLGKSSLAKRLLTRLRDGFPVVLSGRLDSSKFLSLLTRKFENGDARGELQSLNHGLELALLNALRTEITTRDKFPVIVLDDFEQNFEHDGKNIILVDGAPRHLRPEAREVLDALLAAVRRIFNEGGKYPRVMVTCRYALPSRYAQDLPQISLSAFKGEERERLETKKMKQAALEPQELTKRATKTAEGNPRLLENLLKVISAGGVDSKEIMNRLDEVADEQKANLLIDLLLSHQDEAFLKVLDLLLIYHIPVPSAAVAALDEQVIDLEFQLIHGRDLGLIEEITEKGVRKYRIPAAVREVRNGAPSPKEMAQRAAEYLYEVHFVGKNTADALDLEIIRLGSYAEIAQPTLIVGDGLSSYWYSKNRYREAYDLARKLVAFDTENYAVQHSLARAAEMLGEAEEARTAYLAARDLCPEQEREDKEYAAILHNLAGLTLTQGDPQRAMELYNESLAIKEKINDLQGKGATLNQMARVYRQQGDIQRAMELYEESLAIKEKNDDLRGKGVTLHGMAGIYIQQGDPQRAMELYGESLTIDEKIGDLKGKGATLHQMAGVYLQQGDPQRAMELYAESLEIKEKVGDLRGKGATLHAMASIHYKKGNSKRAMELYKQALTITEKVGDLRAKGAVLHQMAGIYRDQGELQHAIELYQDSLAIDERVSDLRGQALTRGMLGQLLVQTGEYATGLAYLFIALILAVKTKSREQQQIFETILDHWLISIEKLYGEAQKKAALEFLNAMEAYDMKLINAYAREKGYIVPFERPKGESGE